ncbi:MAG: Uma2 family endonuclease [Armatimonas sp.]
MAAAEKLMTPAEFLDWETDQPEKHEYVAGSIYAMAGGTYEHALLATRVVQFMGNQLKSPCHALSEGLKVQLGAAFVYPDALVLCDEPIFYNFRTDTITNPTVIFEILSDSTEAFDRGEKFRRYRNLEGLKAVVFIGQNSPLVECWTRVGDAWRAREWESLDDVAELAPIDVRIALRDLYDGLF